MTVLVTGQLAEVGLGPGSTFTVTSHLDFKKKSVNPLLVTDFILKKEGGGKGGFHAYCPQDHLVPKGGVPSQSQPSLYLRAKARSFRVSACR